MTANLATRGTAGPNPELSAPWARASRIANEPDRTLQMTPSRTCRPARMNRATPENLGGVVAGAGIEPATFGL